MRVGIVVAEWNDNITKALLEGAIGCVIRGDTPHFDYICQAVSSGISKINVEGDVPVIFGLLTTNSQEQAEERSGGILGNKGDEYAITALKMVAFAQKYK